MKLLKKTKVNKQETRAQKDLRMGLYSATSVEHSYVKGGVRDGGMGNAQKLVVMQMLRNDKNE